jgi:hypothetical protein
MMAWSVLRTWDETAVPFDLMVSMGGRVDLDEARVKWPRGRVIRPASANCKKAAPF